MKKMQGIIIPCVTPFDESGEVRLDWLTWNYKKWNETGISGCMALGTNGEFRSLDDEESFQVIRAASEAMNPDKIFIAGAGRESLKQTLDFIRRLEEAKLRIDYISVLTPCYFKKMMTDEALIDYYTRIADASSYPVLLYCAPGYANDVRISVDAVRVLADHPNIAGIKDTSPDMMNVYQDAVGGREDFVVFAGALNNLKACILRGGKGGILSSANYFPETCANFSRILEEKGMDEAFAYLDKMKLLASKTGGRAGVAGVKAAMNLMGYKGGVPRRPVLSCSEELKRQMQEFIEKNREILLD